MADGRSQSQSNPNACYICKEKVPRRVLISFELKAVLLELRELQMKTGARHGYVFIRENGVRIKDICRAFEVALKMPDSGITPHSFRRAYITRRTDLGIPTDIVKRASGHTDGSLHGDYLIFTDEMIVRPFRGRGLMSPPSERKQAVVG